MRAIRRILVAVKDPASRSAGMLNKAAQLARALGARLELFHALASPIYADTFVYGELSFRDVQRQMQQQALKRLEALAARLKSRGRQPALAVTFAAEWDYPAYEAVIRRAVASKADLIVAERHAGHHFAAALLHLNDWELLRLSPIPTLLVKAPGLYRHPVVLAAVDPSHASQKPAQLDAQILQVSAAVSGALGGRLHAVHAYMPVPSGRQPFDALDPQTAASFNARLTAAAMARFESVLRGVKAARIGRHLVDLPPVEAIQQVATSLRSDIVAMGVVSRSGLRRVLIGHTAESLLDHLSCDLLIVKPPGFKNRVARARSGPRLVPAMSPWY